MRYLLLVFLVGCQGVPLDECPVPLLYRLEPVVKCERTRPPVIMEVCSTMEEYRPYCPVQED